MKKERKEALLRIPIGIVCGIIAELWGILTVVLAIINFFVVLFTAKRNKNLSKFANLYVSYLYSYLRYMMFTTNIRPFPFNDVKEVEKVDYKSQN